MLKLKAMTPIILTLHIPIAAILFDISKILTDDTHAIHGYRIKTVLGTITKLFSKASIS